MNTNTKKKSKKEEIIGLIKANKNKSILKEDFIPFVSSEENPPLIGLKYISNLKDSSDEECDSSVTRDNQTNASDLINPTDNLKQSDTFDERSDNSRIKRLKLSDGSIQTSNSSNNSIRTEKSNESTIGEAQTIKSSGQIRNRVKMNRVSICTSEESIDLNDLKGYHDFSKTDNDSSSESSYCEIIDDDAHLDSVYGCIEMNVNLNEQMKSLAKIVPSSVQKSNNIDLITDHIKSPSNDQKNAKPDQEHEDDLLEVEVITPSNSTLSSSSSHNNLTNNAISTDSVVLKYKQPWIVNEKSYSGIVGLHNEIQDFYDYSKLRFEEIKVRNYVYVKIKTLVLKKWPDAKLCIFGSYQTRLSLPSADLDIVIFNFVRKIPFYQLEAILVETGLTTYQDTKIITKASVPIIKFVHKDSGLNVDLSFNCEDGPQAIGLINGYLKKYPVMTRLLLIMKQFLIQRNMNFAYTGGLSSYSLTLMMISFFQRHYRQKSLQSNGNNLGVLLLEFLEFYGILFNQKIFAIRVSHGGHYLEKKKLPTLFALEVNTNRICIEDPFNSSNNTSKNSFLYEEIKRSFRNALYQLVNRIYSEDRQSTRSILGELVGYSDYEIEQRQRILQFYENNFVIRRSPNNKPTFNPQSDFIPFTACDDEDVIPDKIIGFAEFEN